MKLRTLLTLSIIAAVIAAILFLLPLPKDLAAPSEPTPSNDQADSARPNVYVSDGLGLSLTVVSPYRVASSTTAEGTTFAAVTDTTAGSSFQIQRLPGAGENGLEPWAQATGAYPDSVLVGDPDGTYAHGFMTETTDGGMTARAYVLVENETKDVYLIAVTEGTADAEARAASDAMIASIRFAE